MPTNRRAKTPEAKARQMATRRNAPPPPRGNTRAVRTGVQANGENLPGFEDTKQEVEQALKETGYIRRSDLPLLEIFVREFHTYRFTDEALQRLPDNRIHKKVSATRLQIRRARGLRELADSLGMSPMARAKLGLTVAQTAEVVHVKPVRNAERAQNVANILATNGGLPRPQVTTDADAEEGE